MIKTINFAPGDIVKVHELINEMPTDDGKEAKGPRTRIQIFEGTVIAVQGRGSGKSFSVRKIVEGIGVEKNIEKVEIKSHSKKKVTKSKLYLLRKRTE